MFSSSMNDFNLPQLTGVNLCILSSSVLSLSREGKKRDWEWGRFCLVECLSGPRNKLLARWPLSAVSATMVQLLGPRPRAGCHWYSLLFHPVLLKRSHQSSMVNFFICLSTSYSPDHSSLLSTFYGNTSLSSALTSVDIFYLLHKFDFDIQETALRLNIPELNFSTIATVKRTSSAWSQSSRLQPEVVRSWRIHDCEKKVW